MDFDCSLLTTSVIATATFSLLSYKFQGFSKLVNLLLAGVIVTAICIFSLLIRRPINVVPYLLYKRVFDGTDRSFEQYYFWVCLLLFWNICVVSSLLFCCIVNVEKHSSTIRRKFFHLIISFIYVSGLRYDVEFLWLSSWLMVCIFVILEALRSSNIHPWDAYLNDYCLVFLDDQDSPLLVLTPLYLIVGISLPIFLKPIRNTEPRHLYHYAGVLSVGIGDSFAAIVGSEIGFHKWHKSKKSYEGSLAMAISQILFSFSFALSEHECSLGFMQVLRIFLSSILCSYAEAKLSKFDNIVLPLIAYSFL